VGVSHSVRGRTSSHLRRPTFEALCRLSRLYMVTHGASLTSSKTNSGMALSRCLHSLTSCSNLEIQYTARVDLGCASPWFTTGWGSRQCSGTRAAVGGWSGGGCAMRPPTQPDSEWLMRQGLQTSRSVCIKGVKAQLRISKPFLKPGYRLTGQGAGKDRAKWQMLVSWHVQLY
jgi:hypothetical protein